MSATDRRVVALARRQHGMVSARQLRAAGVSRTAVGDRVADGRLRAIHQGVYAVGQPTQRGRWMGAVLALGQGAALSHRAGAALHNLASSEGVIDVTVARRVRGRPGLRVHQVRALIRAI